MVNDISFDFVRHGDSLESPLEHQTDYLTPIERFFVCNSGTTPRIDSENYALRIWGDGVTGDTVFRYDELLKLPQRTVPALMECAGNHRSMFRDVLGKSLQKQPGTTELIWSMGAVGMAEWTGVSLRDVLALTGVSESAIQVCPTGSETDSCEGEIRMPLPIAKAMDPDTLLAFAMNGSPLPAAHGCPVRVLVPGWIGAYSVKWVQDIEVRCEPLWVKRNTKLYVLKGDQWPVSDYAPADGAPITDLNIKSALALPWPASLPTGTSNIHGYARSPGCGVARVQWSQDAGSSWHNASLSSDNRKYGWVRFDFTWQADPGDHVLMTRAIDHSGLVQPATIPFNQGGYLFNAIHPHAVHVYRP